MRALMITLHKYLGLFLGLLLALIGLTGSVLVFDHALDEALNPGTMTAAPESQPAPLAQVLAAAQAAVPGQPEPTRIYLPRQPGSTHVVRFPTPERDGATGPIEVSVDPYSAEVLSQRMWGSYTMTWLYRLHYTLLAGSTGKTIVGICGLLLLFFGLSGLYIWWPRRGQWKRALTIKWGSGAFRLNYDLHKTVGFYLLPVLVVVSFSGVALVFRGPVEDLVGLTLPLQERPAPRSVVPAEPRPVDVDRAVAVAQRVFPQAQVKRIYLPRGAAGSYHVALNQPGEAWSSHAATAVWVDQYSGQVLEQWDPLSVAPGSKFLGWQFPLHNGDALGLVGRWLVFISGLTPALFFITGFYMWWRKRAPRRRPASAERHPAVG